MQSELKFTEGTPINCREKRGRVFTIVSDEGYLTKEKIINGLKKSKGIEFSAWIKHDKDLLIKEHYHVVIQYANPQRILTVANAFGVNPSCVWIWTGTNAFLRRVRYLTHETEEQQNQHKHRYDDEEVHCLNFDLRPELNRLSREEQTHGGRRQETKLENELVDGVTLAQIRKENLHLAVENETKFAKLRLNYLAALPLPATRMNYYVSGEFGNDIACGNISRLTARALGAEFFPDLQSDELFYETSAGSDLRNFLLGYDGQPIVIWHGFSGSVLQKSFKNYLSLESFFNEHPSRVGLNERQQGLINSFNIIDSTESFDDFKFHLFYPHQKTLADCTKILGGAFQLLFRQVDDEQFELWKNKGYFENTREYGDYLFYCRVTAPSYALLESNDALRQKHLATVMGPVLEQTHEGLGIPNKQESDEDEDAYEVQIDYEYSTIPKPDYSWLKPFIDQRSENS